MKSKPSLANLLTVLLVAIASATGGWIGRGMFTQRTATSQATAPPSAEISRAGSSSAASLTSQHSGGVSAEEPKVIAMRLLRADLDGTLEEGNEELLVFRFQQALAGCDESAVAEMLEFIIGVAKDPSSQGFKLKYGVPPALSRLFIRQMAAFNPRKALDFQLGLAQAQAQAGMDVDLGTFSMVMALLADQNAPDVQNVIESLPPGGIRASAQMAWWNARSKADPEAVFQSLMNLDADARNSLSSFPSQLQGLLYALSLQAPEKALQAAALFPEDDKGSFSRDELVRAWIGRDGKAARKWALEQNDAQALWPWLDPMEVGLSELDEKSLRDNFSSITSKNAADRIILAKSLATNLAKKDIPEAVRWASTLPIDEQSAANVPVARAWIKQDAPAAAEWLTTWPAGASKDEAVESLTEAIVEDDPESALTWAASLHAKERFSLMKNALETLTEKDPAAAERAMQGLSEEDRAVLSVMKRTGLGG